MTRRPSHRWLIGSAGLFAWVNGALAAGKTDAAKVDFERQVRPLLAARCFSCHGPNRKQAGLRLDVKADALRGGDSGAAIKPGHSAESMLIRYVSGADPKKVMPPTGDRLTPAEAAILRGWIDQGAVWPDAADATVKGKHWAFIAPVRRPIPAVRRKAWSRNPIDTFILARLEKEGLRPSPEADRATLIRRLSFDLLGLPPTPAEVDAFLADRTPYAYEALVDRLLASQHFGERWGRHWLDLARYADSDGYEKDLPRPYAYLYRDWVIRAVNADVPFDRFTIEQLAGDLLPDSNLDQKIATGFHRNTLKNREGGADQEEDRNKIAVDRANTTGTVWLGLTVGCAECHSHKFDPISQREYYGLFAFFNGAQDADLPAATPAQTAAYEAAKRDFELERDRLAALLAAFERDQLPARQSEWERSRKLPDTKLPPDVAAALAAPEDQRSVEQRNVLAAYFRKVDPEYQKLTMLVVAQAKKAPAPPATRAPTISQNPKPPATYLHVRGDFLRKGEAIEPHTPAVLTALRTSDSSPSRLDLAKWLVDPANPLTARVTVNRVWQHLFGRGLVATPDDFGTRGERPSHPELLDWLAIRFATGEAPGLPATQPWGVKAMIKLIVTSAAYRQSSGSRPDLEEKDPRNVLLARQSRFRPEAEIVRDLNLAASGLLNREIGGPSIRPPLPADIAALGYAGSVKWDESKGAEGFKRGMYIFYQRTVPYPMLSTFDAPDGNTTCTRRERSNTPLQALTLLNDPVFFQCAQALGRRIVTENHGPVEDRIRHGFRICLSREPSKTELTRLKRLHAEMLRLCTVDPAQAEKLAGGKATDGVTQPELAAWVTVARTLLNLDEFVTRE